MKIARFTPEHTTPKFSARIQQISLPWRAPVEIEDLDQDGSKHWLRFDHITVARTTIGCPSLSVCGGPRSTSELSVWLSSGVAVRLLWGDGTGACCLSSTSHDWPWSSSWRLAGYSRPTSGHLFSWPGPPPPLPSSSESPSEAGRSTRGLSVGRRSAAVLGGRSVSTRRRTAPVVSLSRCWRRWSMGFDGAAVNRLIWLVLKQTANHGQPLVTWSHAPAVSTLSH